MEAERRLEARLDGPLTVVDQDFVTPTYVPKLATLPQGIRITIETTIDSDHLEEFFDLYLAAFGPLRTRAVARQVLHRYEFDQQMNDPRIWKYVAWDDEDRPMGISTLTRDLSTVPWISPEYFAARYPEHTARNAVYYWGFTLARPHRRGNRVFKHMLTAVVEHLAINRAVCSYDICAFNNATMQFGDQIETLSQRLTEVSFEIIDTQTYYAATFP